MPLNFVIPVVKRATTAVSLQERYRDIRMPRDPDDAKALKDDDAPLPPIITKAIQYCWSNGFLDIFRKYFR